jgi:enoyl-CoA hydratase/carnithine racemase
LSPREAAQAGLADGILSDRGDLLEAVRAAAHELTGLNAPAYALSKARMRAALYRRALELLPEERLPGEA